MSVSTHGGYRQPASPAPVSGPGAFSARTDGGVMNPNSPSYGEVADVQSLKQTAPMAGTAGAPPQGGGAPGADPFAGLVGLGAPSGDAGTPVTAGAAMGAGPGLEALGLPRSAGDERRSDARSLDPGLVKALIARASSEDATASFKRRVREVIANL